VLGDSGVLHVTLGADGSWQSGALTAVRLVSPGLPALDPEHTAFGLVRTLSAEDFGDDAMRVSPTGTLVPPSGRH
jgi:hypothetical protein